MKTMFSRQFALTASLIGLSVVLLSLALRVFAGSYAAAQTRKTLIHNADAVAELASSYDSADQLYYSWEVRINLSFASEVADTDAVICDEAGRVIVCSCSTPRCEHLGLMLDESYVQRVLDGGLLSSSGAIPGLYEDERYLVATPIVSQFGGNTIGFVLVSTPRAQTREAISRMTDVLLMIGLGVLLLAMLATSVLVRSMCRPLRELAAAARQFGHGDLSTRVATGGDDPIEIDELAVAFNSMAASIEQSEVRRSEFVANVSHELKTPMTTIAGFLDGMLDGTIPPERHPEYMQTVAAEVRRLSRLVRSMLEISRLQSQGIPDSRKRVFDICEHSLQTLLSFERKINERGLDVAVDTPDEPVEVFADADAITQVVYNLLDNAIKFSADGGTIRLAVARVEEKVQVAISNTGPTIPEAELALIFDRFHKTDKSRSIDRDGVGLGLYIVRTIILGHGEDITVTSKGGETTFTFTLPLPK